MKVKTIEVCLVVILLSLLAFCLIGCDEESEYQKGWQVGFNKVWADYEMGFNDGLRSPHNVYKREHQTSEYQYSGYSFDLIKTLCEKNNIDYEGCWILSCPKCKKGGARIQRTLTGSIYYGWHHRSWELEAAAPDEVVNSNDWGGQTYCGKCLYPFGTDWRISKPQEEDDYMSHGDIEIPKGHRGAMGLGEIVDCIPTWPDYTELEKNLMIGENWVIPKGTKIYFKE